MRTISKKYMGMFLYIKVDPYPSYRHVNRPHKGKGYLRVLRKKIVPLELTDLVLQLENV